MPDSENCPPIEQSDIGITLVDKARALQPLLREHASANESARRVSADVFGELSAIGLLRAYIPKKFGGFEVSPRWFWRIAAEISAACPSTGWVFSVLSCHTFIFSMFDEDCQREVFSAHPDVAISGVLPDRSTAEVVDGGLSLNNGLWPFGSGCHNAELAMLGTALIGYPPGYNKAFCMVPMSYIEIVDDWHVSGLKATGSNSLKLKSPRMFVPQSQTLKAEVALSHKFSQVRPQLYRTPMAPVLALSLGLGTTIGTAKAALEDFEDLVTQRSNKPMVYTLQVRKTDLPATRRALAQATARLDSACLLADRACDLTWHAAANPDHVLDNETRAKIRLYGVHVMHECREVVNALYLESGGSSLHEKSPMQRFNRDIQAMTMHEAMHLGTIQDTYGRVRLNQPTDHWLL